MRVRFLVSQHEALRQAAREVCMETSRAARADPPVTHTVHASATQTFKRFEDITRNGW